MLFVQFQLEIVSIEILELIYIYCYCFYGLRTSNKLTGTSFFIRYFCTWATASLEYSCFEMQKRKKDFIFPKLLINQTKTQYKCSKITLAGHYSFNSFSTGPITFFFLPLLMNELVNGRQWKRHVFMIHRATHSLFIWIVTFQFIILII